MRLLIQIIFAIAGAAVSVFYLGSIASNSFIASRNYDNPDDVMVQHSVVYLATLFGCILVGWLLGRIIGLIFCRS